MELMTKEKKDDFKRTDVGLIPEEWEFKSLDSFCDVRDGTHASPKYHQEGVKFVTSKNIIDGRIDFSDISYISKNDAIEIDKRSKVEKNDILMSMIGTIGNSALVDFEPDFSIKNVALIKPIKISPKFLAQYLSSKGFKDYLENKLAGGIQKFVSLGVLRGLKVPVPTPEEQQAIASALSDVDKLIRSLDGLIQKKQAIKKGTMQQLLSGKNRLPGFDGEWEEMKLGELADIQRGASPRPISDPRWFSENKEVGWVRISDISKSDGKYLHKTRDYLSEEGMNRSRYLESGSLIMSIAATVGLPVITQMDLCIHDGFVGFWNLRGVDKEFLFYKLKFHEEEFINAGQTGSQNNINSDIVKNFESHFPSVKEQKAIAQILSDMDRELQTLRQKREKYVQIKQGMMQELLTGKVRLV